MPERETTGTEQRGYLSFADGVAFIRRHWAAILACTIAGGVVAALLIVASPQEWEASSTLVIVPPKFSSELKPASLTVQGYQKLMESDGVVAETKKRLVAAGLMDQSQPLRVGTQLSTRIFVSRRSDATTLAPMIEASARATTPKLAAATANEWTQVFLERSRDIMAGSTSLTVKFIDAQYPKIRDELITAENARLEKANELHSRQDEASTRWDETITAFGDETTILVSKYQAESDELISSFQAEHSLDLRADQLQSLRQAYTQLQSEQAQVKAQLEQKRLQLKAALAQMGKTPQVLSLRKAITDEALWQEVAKEPGDGPDWNALRDRTLVKEQVNPVYSDLSTRASQLAIETDALVPRAAELDAQLKDMAERIKGLDSALRGDTAKLSALQGARAAGMTNLRSDRANQTALLSRNRDAELAQLQALQQTRLAQMDRDIQAKNSLFEQLANNFNQALLAKAQENIEDVRLASAAVPPEAPVGRRAGVEVILGLLLGALVGVVLSLTYEAWPS